MRAVEGGELEVGMERRLSAGIENDRRIAAERQQVVPVTSTWPRLRMVMTPSWSTRSTPSPKGRTEASDGSSIGSRAGRPSRSSRMLVRISAVVARSGPWSSTATPLDGSRSVTGDQSARKVVPHGVRIAVERIADAASSCSSERDHAAARIAMRPGLGPSSSHSPPRTEASWSGRTERNSPGPSTGWPMRWRTCEPGAPLSSPVALGTSRPWVGYEVHRDFLSPEFGPMPADDIAEVECRLWWRVHEASRGQG